MIPLYMVKLFRGKINKLAEGVGGEVLQYEYEEEEGIEEDTSTQAQHAVSGQGGDANRQEDSSSESTSGSSSSDESVEHDGGTQQTVEHGVALGERVAVEEQEGETAVQAVEEQEGEAAVHERGAGVQHQEEGGEAAQEGAIGGQQQEGGKAAQQGATGGQQQEGVTAAQQGATGGQQQEGVTAAQQGATGGQQQEGVTAAQQGATGGQQQEGVTAAQEGGAGGQEQEGGEAMHECLRGDERQVGVTRIHRTASGSGQAGPSRGRPSTVGHSTSDIASGGQVVELLQRVAEVDASQKQLVADVFAKHSEQAVVFNRLAADFRTAWGTISESSKRTLKQCADAVNGVTEERKLLEGVRTKLDEMSGKIIEGVAAAIVKASEDAVEKQLKLVEERLAASVMKGIENAVKEDLFYSNLPPETMKQLKDIVREGHLEGEAGRLEVLTEAVARGLQRSTGPSTRSRQEGVAEVRSGTEPRLHTGVVPPSSSVGGHVGSRVASPPSRGRHPVAKSVEDNEVIVLDQSPLPKSSEAAAMPPTDAFAPMRDILQGLGITGGKGVVAGEKSGAAIDSVAADGKKALGKRGVPTPSGGAAGQGAGETSAGLLSKTKAASAAQSGGAGRPVELVGYWASSSTPAVAPVAAPALGDVCLSDPGSPSMSKKKPAATKSSKRSAQATESFDVVELASLSGQAPVVKTSTVVAARQEKAKKAKVMGYTPPPRPDDQGKTRGSKAPFRGPGFGLRKGKPVSEQTVGGRKRFLGTFETEKDQKFCTAVCWRVYFPDIVLTEYEWYTAQDEKDWKVYLDAAAEMPTGVWSVAQEQGECRFDDFKSLLATAEKEVRAGTDRGIALCVAIGKVATLGLKHGNLIYPVPKGMAATPHMMAIAATVASLWAACRKLSREDIEKDALAAANAALYAPETASKACVAAMAALVSILLHVGKTFPAKQWPDQLYSTAVQGLGSTDAILLQMLRVAAQVCTQWCCCRAAARLLEDAGYGNLAMPEEKSKAKLGDEDAAETKTAGQGE
ncbi:unnamed protein product [Closterium sp. Naga37s-1]|nr:unnamed protein product [Closterium sp. Naga37s-1]